MEGSGEEPETTTTEAPEIATTTPGCLLTFELAQRVDTEPLQEIAIFENYTATDCAQTCYFDGNGCELAFYVRSTQRCRHLLGASSEESLCYGGRRYFDLVDHADVPEDMAAFIQCFDCGERVEIQRQLSHSLIAVITYEAGDGEAIATAPTTTTEAPTTTSLAFSIDEDPCILSRFQLGNSVDAFDPSEAELLRVFTVGSGQDCATECFNDADCTDVHVSIGS